MTVNNFLLNERSFWYLPSEASSVEGRLRAIFSQNGPKLVTANKKFVIWLYLTLYHLKSEKWRIEMTETGYQKAFKIPAGNFAYNARGHFDKIRPRVLANHSARYTFSSSCHIIKMEGADNHFSEEL